MRSYQRCPAPAHIIRVLIVGLLALFCIRLANIVNVRQFRMPLYHLMKWRVNTSSTAIPVAKTTLPTSHNVTPSARHVTPSSRNVTPSARRVAAYNTFAKSRTASCKKRLPSRTIPTTETFCACENPTLCEYRHQ